MQLYQATGGNFMVITVTHDDLEMQLNVVLTSVLGRSWGGTGGGGGSNNISHQNRTPIVR